MRSVLRYLSRGSVVTVEDFAPTATLLDHLRLTRGLKGTKEGCGEGDCGACTVAIGRLEDGEVRYRPVNACIQLLGQIDGADIVTIEDLAAGGVAHPVQDAMVAHHGSQCGFCTPGIVMSLAVLADSGREASRPAINDALAGNLCRCTGYRPIVEAAFAALATRPPALAGDGTRAALAALADSDDLMIAAEGGFFAAPATIDALARLYAAHPDATLVAGATDVGLWVTKRLSVLPKVIALYRIRDLQGLIDAPGGLTIGAGVTYEDAEDAIGGLDPDLALLWRRIGSRQVRASGTVGGNIANGSPIGDTPPALIALGATLTLRQGETTRQMPLEAYFLAYGRQDRRPGEFVAEVFVPRPAAHQRFKALKLSKRFDQDISAVMSAFLFDLDGNRITAARIAYGGMAATPKRAAGAEAAIVGASLADEATWAPAIAALGADFQPLSDMRASSSYRIEAAKALMFKALAEIAGADLAETRVWEAAQ